MEFKDASENCIFAIRRSISDKINVVLSLEALFNASELVERTEFQIFSESLLQHKTGIQALEWIPRVPDSERLAYEEAAIQNGFPDFQITERQKQGLMVRAGKRDEYFPVYYLEPLQSNEMALGFDIGSDPSRLEALRSSCDTAEMKATPKVTLVQEAEKQSAFLVLKPIYNKIPADSMETRRKSLKGFVLGAFRIEDIVEDALAVVRPVGIDLYLYDESEIDPDNRLLYYHSSRTRLETSSPHKDEATILQQYKFTLPVKVADRTWQVYAIPAPGFFSSRVNWQRWGIPSTVFIFTILGVGYLFFIFDREEESKQHAEVLSESINRLELEIVERNRAEKALLTEKENLREALAEIKTLRGIIPICSYCKKIRDDQGLWNQLESYLRSHSNAEFSHGVCPECHKKMMEDMRNMK